MTLVFDNRSNLQGEPGFHALIAGVSLYRHLPGGGDDAAEEDWSLPQLSATALTGYKIYRWLIDHRHQLPKKLATVRLLLSPSVAESPQIEQGMKDIREMLASEGVTLETAVSSCNLRNFSAEARAWRTDARTHDDHMTFFYFTGHGIQRENNDPVLLLEDFGNPEVDFLTNSVVFKKLVAGMVPQADQLLKMARTQLYFVDSCRVIPPNLNKYEFQSISNILTGELGGVDNRSAPIYYGTVSNTQAYAKTGQQTLFSEALMACLEGDGGEATDEEGADGYAKWRVSTYSLSAGLNSKIAELKALQIDQEYHSAPGGHDATIVNLDTPPLVEGTLEIEPEQAIPLITVDLTDSLGTVVWNLSPVNPHPYQGRLRADFYTIKAVAKPPYADYSKIVSVKPPKGFRMKARVGS